MQKNISCTIDRQYPKPSRGLPLRPVPPQVNDMPDAILEGKNLRRQIQGYISHPKLAGKHPDVVGDQLHQSFVRLTTEALGTELLRHYQLQRRVSGLHVTARVIFGKVALIRPCVGVQGSAVSQFAERYRHGAAWEYDHPLEERALEIWPETPADWAVGYTPGELS